MMKRVLLAALSAAFLAGVSAAPSYAQATQQPASTTQKPAAKTPRAKRAPTPGQLSARQRMKQFLLMLEPIAILLIGVVVGGIVAAIMLAITSVNQVAL